METAIRGDRVKRLRSKRGLTQKELAAIASVSQSYVSEIESGKQKSVGSIVVLGLAHVLGTSIDYLVGNTDDPAPVETKNLEEDTWEIIRELGGLSREHQQC